MMAMSDADYKRFIKYVKDMLDGKKTEADYEGDDMGMMYPMGTKEGKKKEMSYEYMKEHVKSDVHTLVKYKEIHENELRMQAAVMCARYKAKMMKDVVTDIEE